MKIKSSYRMRERGDENDKNYASPFTLDNKNGGYT